MQWFKNFTMSRNLRGTWWWKEHDGFYHDASSSFGYRVYNALQKYLNIYIKFYEHIY